MDTAMEWVLCIKLNLSSCYNVLNFENFSISPKTKESKICDNDPEPPFFFLIHLTMHALVNSNCMPCFLIHYVHILI